MGITKDEYCIKICGGKCCVGHGIVCKHLKEGACKIYHQRFGKGSCDFQMVDVVQITRKGKVEREPFFCLKINKLLELNLLPQEIRDQCVYAHPEVMEKY